MTTHKVEYLTDIGLGQLKAGDTIEVEIGYSRDTTDQPGVYDVVPFNESRKDFDIYEWIHSNDLDNPYIEVYNCDELIIDGTVTREHTAAFAKHFKLTAEDLK